MWKQEARNPALTAQDAPTHDASARPGAALRVQAAPSGLLVAVGLGTRRLQHAGHSARTLRRAGLRPECRPDHLAHRHPGRWHARWLCACSARRLAKGGDPYRIASLGILAGIFAFAAVIFAPLLELVSLFQTGAFFIGFGGGLFSVGMLTAAMELASSGSGTMSGIALGAWGGVQATAAGLAIARQRHAPRRSSRTLPNTATLGAAFSGPAAGYIFVYQIEIVLLFATLVAIGPLVRVGGGRAPAAAVRLRSGGISRLTVGEKSCLQPSPSISTSPRWCSTCSGLSSRP